MENKLKTGIEILTMRVDMICGVMSQKAFEQCSGNRQQASSFIKVTVDRTSCERKNKTTYQRTLNKCALKRALKRKRNGSFMSNSMINFTLQNKDTHCIYQNR